MAPVPRIVRRNTTSQADRDAQVRTPITDGSYGKPRVFRTKDIRAWWSNAHHDRPGGVESTSTTAWVAKSKPIRFTEAGCPAVDKGANQPNVFVDPKSSESFRPYYSRGVRDDLVQRRYLQALVKTYSGGPVGADTLAAALSEARDSIEEVIEPYLMQQGFVARTPRGRVATPKAWERIGLKAPATFQQPLFEEDSDEA